ncbi:MAG: [protein-PII] uridylyltransferase [Pseudomonadota bacterium]|nr:[protein-PII] uridylyltransferase [Pseudomonadota bacterium]
MTNRFAEIAAGSAPSLDSFDSPRASLQPIHDGHQDRIRSYKETCRRFSEALSNAFATGESPLELTAARTRFVDRVLINAWNDLGAAHPHADQAALLAVGGYGRGELYPHSDIDILLLCEGNRQLRRAESFLQRFVTFLWDIGLEPGQSVRTLRQCRQEAKADLTVMTTMMECRFLAGDRHTVARLEQVLSNRRVWPSRKFHAAKVAERNARHRTFGDTAHRLEPTVKESPGGLRDIQTLFWIAKRHYGVSDLPSLIERNFLTEEESVELEEAQRFLSAVRSGVQILAGRKDDLLNVERQRILAAHFGYRDEPHAMAVEQFMRRYYTTVMGVSRIAEMLHQELEEDIELDRRRPRIRVLNERFEIRGAFIENIDPDLFEREPAALLELFLLLQQHRNIVRGVRAGTIRLVRKHRVLIDDAFRANPKHRDLFLKIIRQPHGISHELRRMNRYGVLARYIPAFRRVVGLMQHDLFHVYTVDEHSLFVVRNVRLYADRRWCDDVPHCHDIFVGLAKPELLYLAALFHDIGKGQGGDHSAIGAREALAFCHDHGLSETDCASVEWLVRNHLIMSMVSQRQDISDPEVINDFATRVGDAERLDLLYLLTIADMKGTSPTVWNSWKGSLLEGLYTATRRVLRRGLALPDQLSERVAQQRAEALANAQQEGLDTGAVTAFWQTMDEDYFVRFTPSEIAWHAKFLASADEAQRSGAEAVVATRNLPEGGTGVMVYSRNRPGLFAAITGVLDAANLNIVDARIYTTPSGFALDNFIVLDGDGAPIADKEARRELRHRLRETLARERLEPREIVRKPSRLQRSFQIAPEVNLFSDARRNLTVLEVICADRPGLLSRIAAVLSDREIEIHDARINTFGERVEDVFTISTATGEPLDDPLTIAALRSAVLTALTPAPKSKAAA